MFFSDIHTHLLYGVDDGAGDVKAMLAMVDMAYADGTRLICATPHCCPELFGNNRENIDVVYKELKDYCRNKYPDLQVVLGSELYASDGVTWLKNGLCKTMGGTNYVLAEFGVEEAESSIVKSVQALLNNGYIPIIAHAERYKKLSCNKILEFRKNGVLVQVNATDMREISFFEKIRLKRLLSKKLVDFVSTDVHNLHNRLPIMSGFYKYISHKYGKEYADKICCLNARELFGNVTEE